MATSSDNPDVSIRVIEEGLTCNICYNLLREPRDLDCPHVFCLECLKKWVKKESIIECPECRHITIVPEGGLANLKPNLRLKTMIETYAKTKRVDKQRNVPMCPNHDGERQHFFCVTCNVTVCPSCLVLDHPRPQHEIEEIKVVCKKRKAEIQNKIQHIKGEVEKAEDAARKFQEMESKMEAATKKAKDDIKTRAQQLIREVKVKEKELIEQIDEICKPHMNKVQDQQKQITNRSKRLKNAYLVAQTEVNETLDHRYVVQHASLMDNIEKLCSKKPRVAHHDIPIPDSPFVQFHPASSQLALSCFGDSVLYGNKILRLKLITEFGEFDQAQGVAATQAGLLAIVDAKAKEVIIYRNENGEYKQLSSTVETLIKGDGRVTRPLKVAATSDGKLFISNDGVVKVFSPAGTYERSWTSSVVADKITTTPDDMIVIENEDKGVITVHQSNGELIRTHQADCGNMQDMASNGKQISFTTGSKGQVCAIDFVTGQTLWTLDTVMPLGICYEQKSGTLLIAGGAKTRGQFVIEQYCSTTGRLISRLASGLHDPLAMTVTHDSKLVVADWKTVKVYQID